MKSFFKTIINTLVFITTLAVGAWLFPERIMVQDTRSLATAAVVYIFWEIAISLVAITLLFLILAIFKTHTLGKTASLVAVITITKSLIALYITQLIVEGFQINGFLTYLAIGLATLLFSVNDESE